MGGRFFITFKGGVIGGQFLGRSRYLAELMKEAGADRPQHISLYGLPHVGKTSILQEWLRRLEDMQGTTESERPLLVLEETIQVGERDEEGNRRFCYGYLLQSLLWSLQDQIVLGQQAKRLPCEDEVLSGLVERLQEAWERSLADLDLWDTGEAADLLEEALLAVSGRGVRTVLVLDEFERAGQSWDEEEYLRLMTILLDRRLDLFCVVASRPHISYVVNRYVRKVSPFRPLLVEPFSDEDMDLFCGRVREAVPENAVLDDGDSMRELLYYCGRNPYLLTRMAAAMEENPSDAPRRLFRQVREDFYTHFEDVVGFMLYEESREEKSFSHIVKCYFGASDDYQDIIGTYISLGYIELNDPDSPYTYPDDRYGYRPRGGEKRFFFTTVCAAFIRYLYIHKLREIRDVRDLLTGLIHSIRDITRLELASVYGAGRTGWNREVLLLLYAGAGPGAGPGDDLFVWEDGSGEMKLARRGNLPQPRRDWVNANASKVTRVSRTSLQYAVEDYNRGNNQVMPLLDPISVTDNGRIILLFYNRFCKYFSVLGDLRMQDARDRLIAFLGKVQEDRNTIMHLSRYSMTEAEIDECRTRCIYLLRSIYTALSGAQPLPRCEFDSRSILE